MKNNISEAEKAGILRTAYIQRSRLMDEAEAAGIPRAACYGRTEQEIRKRIKKLQSGLGRCARCGGEVEAGAELADSCAACYKWATNITRSE